MYWRQCELVNQVLETAEANLVLGWDCLLILVVGRVYSAGTDRNQIGSFQ